MTTTAKRALSMLLTVLMLVSMVSVFCFPTYASDDVGASSTIESTAVFKESNKIIDEANLDYEALRKDADKEDNYVTFIINNAWTASNLVKNAKLSYYFRGKTYEETYNAERHFSKWSEVYKVYTTMINENTILDFVPVFIFAPGTYGEQVIVHGNGILLGPNAGINPNDTSVEWKYQNMVDGWPANSAWDTSKVANFTNSIDHGTRDGAEQQNGPYQYYLETAQAAKGSPAELEMVVDGIKVSGSGRFRGSYYDKNNSRNDTVNGESKTYAVKGGAICDRHVQNTVIDSTLKNEMFRSWDVSANQVTFYVTNSRLNLPNTYCLFTKYLRNAYIKGCSITNVSQDIFGDATERSGFGPAGTYRNTRGAEVMNIAVIDSVMANTTSSAFLYGTQNTSEKMTFTFKGNIVCNSSAPLFKPSSSVNSKDAYVNTFITGNQFYNADDKPVTALFDITTGLYSSIVFKENKVVGPFDSMTNADWNSGIASQYSVDISDNYWAAVDGDEGKAHYYSGSNLFTVTDGFANGYDFFKASYYIDSAMKVRNTDADVVSIDGFDFYNFKEDGYKLVIDSKGKEDVVLTADKFGLATTGATLSIVDGTDTAVESITPATEGAYSLKVQFGEFVRLYALEFDNNVVDFNKLVAQAKANGTNIEGLNLDPNNTFLYIYDTMVGTTVKVDFEDVTYYATVEGGARPSVIGAPETLSAIYELDLRSSNGSPFYNIIIPNGVTPAVEVVAPGQYLGSNRASTSVKLGEGMTDEFTLGENWNEEKASRVGMLNVAKGVEGKVVFNGITIAGGFDDTKRTVDSGKLDIEFTNIVVDQSEEFSASAIFTLDNARTKNGSSKFGANYNDSFTIKDVYVHTLKTANRIMGDYVPANVTIDCFYVDFDEAYKGSVYCASVLSNFKSGPANPKTNITVTNSIFRDYDKNVSASSGASALISFNPQKASDYNVTVENNVFYDATKTGAAISFDPSKIASVNISNNHFFDLECDAKAVVATSYTDTDNDGADDVAATHLDDFVIDNNSFMGYYNLTENFDTGLGKREVFTNVYVSLEINYEDYVGIGNPFGAEDYFLNYDKTITFSQFSVLDVLGIDPVTSALSIDHSSCKISFILDKGTFYPSQIDTPAGTYVSDFKDAEGNPLSSVIINEEDPDEERTYTFKLTRGPITRDYELVIYTYAIQDFAEAMDGTEIKDFWLIDSSVRGLTAGQAVAASWGANRFRFYAGVNVFETIDAAYAYATEQGVRANLLLASLTGNLEVKHPVTIYTPAYDTMPHTVGTAPDGSDWAENTEFAQKAVTVGNIIVTNTAVGEVVLNGFVLTGNVQDKARPLADTPNKLILKNFLVNGATSNEPTLFNVSTNSSRTNGNQDVFTAQNVMILNTKAASALINNGAYLPAHVTFDNLYIPDGKTANLCAPSGNVKIIQYGNSSFTIKNSNITDLYAASGTKQLLHLAGENEKDVGTNVKTVTFDNNIFNNFGAARASNFQYPIYWSANAYSDLYFTNNHVIFDGVTGYLVKTMKVTSSNRNKDYGEFVVTGNKFIGLNSKAKAEVITGNYAAKYTMKVYDNFTLNTYDDDYASVTDKGVELEVNTKNTVREGGEGYFLDYDCTIGSSMIMPYELVKLDEYTTVYPEDKKVYYYLDSEATEPKVTITQDGENYVYTVDMTGVIAQLSDYNTYQISYGKTKVALTKVLTFTLSAEEYAAVAELIEIPITITSLDKTVTETITLQVSTKPDAFIPGVIVDHVAGTVVYTVTDTDTAITDNGDGTSTFDISKIVNDAVEEDVTYGENDTAVTVPTTIGQFPAIVDIKIGGEAYKLYVADEFADPVINSLSVAGVDVVFNRGNKGSATVEGGHGSDELIIDTPKYIDIRLLDGETEVDGIAVPNGSSKTYKIVLTNIFDVSVTYELTITVKPYTGDIEDIANSEEAKNLDPAVFTEASIAIFNDALAAAKAVNPSLGQAEIDAAYAVLKDAYDNLVSVADFNAAIAAAEAIEITDDYCADTVATLTAAVEAVKASVKTETNNTVAQAKVDAVYAAIEGLKTHVFTNYVYQNNATCGQDGTSIAVCENGCGKSDEIVKAGTILGHSFTKVTYNNDATCTADGTELVSCVNGCGAEYTRTKANSKVNHVYTNYTVSEDGKTKTAYCDFGCGTTNTVEVGPTPTPSDKVFTDVKTGSWYEEYVDYVAEKGLMNGTGDTTFAPDTTMTRSMLVTILARMAGADTDALKNTATAFTDVPTGKWYSGAVVWAVQNGITTGTTATTFAPDTAVTREDICVFFVRYAQKAGITLKTDVAKTAFPDDAKIGSWAKDAVYACQQAGIVAGTNEGIFNPKGNATRSAVAKIVTVFHKDYIAK